MKLKGVILEIMDIQFELDSDELFYKWDIFLKISLKEIRAQLHWPKASFN